METQSNSVYRCNYPIIAQQSMIYRPVVWCRARDCERFRGRCVGGYTSRMDRVRFGRVLGFGARQAVKTLVTAVDAATATDPSKKSDTAGANSGQAAPLRRATDGAGATGAAPSGDWATARTTPDTPVRKAAQTAVRTAEQAREVRGGLRRGSKRFGEALWGPFVRLSGVLWLEVSGVFFGIFALFALGAVIRLRGQWHAGSAERQQLLGSVAMLALFGYFCVSNFVRARRRERRR